MAKKRILLVDDEEHFCWMVKLNLEKTGKYEVRIETKGARALAAVREFKPDLIFLDIVMPDMDGGEIANQLGSNEVFQGIPIVFLTAVIKKEEAAFPGKSVGGRPVLAKPVTTDKLVSCIEKNTLKQKEAGPSFISKMFKKKEKQ